ncbi:MAG: transporter substrate-binding domain-containing protein [Candidatus Thiodiazotropha sp. (ex Ctena orbiculata)]|uniref:Transporter substrate-binding domain-containing protein n=1 Tax=Candidatus Thiodiazotropha taylori TaxID=2792791 RepID=A0A944QUE0_9GAMM|nr:transporter substrate-binding domain-containing protein [Candidatus Thiodiazotropha taylori]MBV2135278.1 transporter substrate-binding domain-containing protein [Candidatus Thiodiazotropha taylori]
MLYRLLGLCLLGFAVVTQAGTQVARFNPAEKGWLADHQDLRIGVVEMTPPILYFDGSQTKGLVPDYLRSLAEKLGLQLDIVHFDDQEALFAALRSGEVDVMGAALQGETMPADLHCTRPYLSLPAALFATGRIADQGLTALDGLEVSVVAGSIWEDGIPHLLPSLNVMAFNDLGQALRAVLSDRAQAYLGDAASVNHLIATSTGYEGLKEMMRLDMTVDVAMATLYSEPVLQSLLQKGLDRLSTRDMQDIWYNWQGLEAPVKQNSKLLSLTLWGVFILLWSLLIGWVVRKHSQKALAHHRSKTRRSISRLRRRENLLKQKLITLKQKTKRYRIRAKSLRQQVDFLHEVLPSCSWSWDPEEVSCQWDDEMYALAGQERGAFTPDPASILRLAHEQDREQIAQLFEAENRNEIRVSYRLLLADGQLRRVLDYSHYVPGENNGPGRRVGICWDVDIFFNNGVQLPDSGLAESSLEIESTEK